GEGLAWSREGRTRRRGAGGDATRPPPPGGGPARRGGLAQPASTRRRSSRRRRPGPRRVLMRGRLSPTGVLAALLLTAAPCAAAPSGGNRVRAVPGASANSLDAAWTTYHADNSRSGVDPSGAQLTPIHQAWVSPALDGKVYASPLVWQGLVIVATESDTVYGLHATDGTV